MAANDIARVYASSIFDIAKEKNILPQVEEELKAVSEIIAEDETFRNYLSAPGINKDAKKGFIEKVFAGKISEYITNLLKLLIDNSRQTLIN